MAFTQTEIDDLRDHLEDAEKKLGDLVIHMCGVCGGSSPTVAELTAHECATRAFGILMEAKAEVLKVSRLMGSTATNQFGSK